MASLRTEPLLEVNGLTVDLPDGTRVVTACDVVLRESEIVTVLGPSGAGKTTVIRALLHAETLRSEGFRITWDRHRMDVEPAFVPQRGALVDHLDVAGNIHLAQAACGSALDAGTWLEAVGLEPAWASQSKSVATLSGGQAQRVSLARALAAGRRILLLDEPSVGLDPQAVQKLGALLVEQARRHRVAIIVVTHDLSLACDVSDEIVFLDPHEGKLIPVLPDWPGPAADEPSDERDDRRKRLEGAVGRRLRAARLPAVTTAPIVARRQPWLGPVRVAGESMRYALRRKLARESLVVFRRAILQSLVRPIAFYAVVGLLLGITVPYVLVHISPALRPGSVLGLIGGSYILALAPPLSAIVFAATSGSAINAWLGGMRLHGQVVALEGLGVEPRRYLWSPSWLGLLLAYVATFWVFVAAMTFGGTMLFTYYEVPHAVAKLTADFLDPPASRLPYLVRALWLVGSYAVAIASIVVAKGSETKRSSEDVTRAMTSSVMLATLFVVVAELITVAVMFAMTEVGP